MTRKRPVTDQSTGGSYASPPCFMHELSADYSGVAPEVNAQQRTDVARWRKSERSRLIAERMAIAPPERQAFAKQIAKHLDELLGELRGRIISAYWPIRGEPDLRSWLDHIAARGATRALPVVIKRSAPLMFREWRMKGPIESGFWDIPVPADGASVIPDIVLAPVVGFDRGCYRLGYGGGYYDRTLVTIQPRPLIIGVGFSYASIPTIYPQAFDVPMDIVVTEHSIERRPDLAKQAAT